MDFDELYQSIILDHSKRPRNYGELPSPVAVAEGYNPSCGDEVKVFLRRNADDQIEDIRFTGQACAICMASTSLMTAQVKGKSSNAATELQRSFVDFLTKDVDPPNGLGNLLAFAGVKKFPLRLKCATLGWHALVSALAEKEA